MVIWMHYERHEQKLKRLIVGLVLVIISGCKAHIPDIIQVGECEHGIVTNKNLADVKKVWAEAQQTDVLISGGCYQEYFIKKGK
jgi:hypothetical protein